MIAVIILFAVLLVASLIVSRNNVFSPAVITSALWLFCLTLFVVINHNLPSLSHQFLISISLWGFLYVSFALLMQSISFARTNDSIAPSQFVRDVYFWISVLTYPLLLLHAYQAITLGDTGSWTTDLRRAALGMTEHTTEYYGGLYTLVWKAGYFIELFFYSKKNRKRVFILAFFFLSFGFFTMAKLIFLEFFIATICILYFKRVVSLKHLLIGFVALFFLFVGFQTLRESSDETDKQEFVTLYILGNKASFDTLEPASSSHFGEYTFRFFYAIAYRLGISDIEPVSPLLEFISEPLVTNTFTGMHHFFKDFGYWGVAIFASLFGLFFGYLFQKAKSKRPIFVLFYSVLVSMILMQYVADLFLTYISAHIQLIFLLYFPFWAAKRRLFVLKGKNAIKLSDGKD